MELEEVASRNERNGILLGFTVGELFLSLGSGSIVLLLTGSPFLFIVTGAGVALVFKTVMPNLPDQYFAKVRRFYSKRTLLVRAQQPDIEWRPPIVRARTTTSLFKSL